LSSLWIFKSTPLKKTIVTLLLGSIFFTSCQKEDFSELAEMPSAAIPLPCIEQTANPAGRTYDTDSIVGYICRDRHCGMMPLSNKNYWIYEDSIFDNGSFLRVQMDTLRFTNNVKSSDGLIWWESDLYVGLPQRLYSSDSALFLMRQRQYSPDLLDAKKDYSLFSGDSLRYLASFDDIAANGRSLKLSGEIRNPAGTFDDCIYFEKHARNYRKDQVFFKPGVGVLKYIKEEAPMGTRVLKLQNIMTLVAIYID
jgi:hypothetical protein